MSLAKSPLRAQPEVTALCGETCAKSPVQRALNYSRHFPLGLKATSLSATCRAWGEPKPFEPHRPRQAAPCWGLLLLYALVYLLSFPLCAPSAKTKQFEALVMHRGVWRGYMCQNSVVQGSAHPRAQHIHGCRASGRRSWASPSGCELLLKVSEHAELHQMCCF